MNAAERAAWARARQDWQGFMARDPIGCPPHNYVTRWGTTSCSRCGDVLPPDDPATGKAA